MTATAGTILPAHATQASTIDDLVSAIQTLLPAGVTIGFRVADSDKIHTSVLQALLASRGEGTIEGGQVG